MYSEFSGEFIVWENDTDRWGMLSHVTTWMLSEKSVIAFCSDDTCVKVLHVYFICQGILSHKWQKCNSSQL